MPDKANREGGPTANSLPGVLTDKQRGISRIGNSPSIRKLKGQETLCKTFQQNWDTYKTGHSGFPQVRGRSKTALGGWGGAGNAAF